MCVTYCSHSNRNQNFVFIIVAANNNNNFLKAVALCTFIVNNSLLDRLVLNVTNRSFSDGLPGKWHDSNDAHCVLPLDYNEPSAMMEMKTVVHGKLFRTATTGDNIETMSKTVYSLT